jgi:hypothetical protein
MGIGNKPIDGGNYLFTPEEKREFLQKEPAAAEFFIRWMGSEELINGIERWCLCVRNVPPEKLRTMPEVMRRVEAVAAFRAASNSEPTRKLAKTPTRFHVENFPSGKFLAIPGVSSERRPYIPIQFLGNDTLASNLLLVVSPAAIFDFGILSSVAHMAWMRLVAGRLKSDYRYSVKLVYNNFPWPEPSASQRRAVEAAAQGVLDARAEHPSATLADLYDPRTMPPNLAKAHAALDLAVDRCYRSEPFTSEPERVEFLFALYEKLTVPLATSRPTKKPRKKKAVTNEKETKGGT